MARRWRVFVLGLLMAGLGATCGCGDGGGGTAGALQPGREISHEPTGGVDGFFFLPPIARDAPHGGVFDATAQLAVEIRKLDTAELVKRYEMGPTGIRVDPVGDCYLLNWHTNEFSLVDRATYRLYVLRASDDARYGFADVQIFTSMKEAKSLQTDGTFALKDGRTLVIKMRVEQGAQPPPPRPTYVVTTTADNGDNANPTPNSLRSAIVYANANPGTKVEFDIPESDAGYDSTDGTWVFELPGVLPTVTADDTEIDGTTQTARRGDTNQSGPEIVVRGSGSCNGGLCYVDANRGVVRGLVVQGCLHPYWGGWGYGVSFQGGTGHVIESCYLGTDATGTSTYPNLGGVLVYDATSTVIGGPTASSRNVISGNTTHGVAVAGNCVGVRIESNYIGVDRTGRVSLGNAPVGGGYPAGVSIGSTSQCTVVGGARKGNVISCNGNPYHGGAGVWDQGESSVIQGNLIGTDCTGTLALGNYMYGILAGTKARVGGSAEGEGNVIADTHPVGEAYPGHGVAIGSHGPVADYVVVEGNRIGVGLSGQDLGNEGCGIHTYNALVVRVGGSAAGAGNIIGRNGSHGISVYVPYRAYEPPGIQIQGNWIGTDPDGRLLGNLGSGIWSGGLYSGTIGGLGSGEGNEIAYNAGDGFLLTGDGGLLRDTLFRGNRIHHNGRDGIRLEDVVPSYATPQHNRFIANSFWQNGGLAVNLVGSSDPPSGVTLNDNGDADVGPNHLINFAVIESAKVDRSGASPMLELKGWVRQGSAVDLYLADPEDTTDFPEGRTYLLTLVEGSGDDRDQSAYAYSGPIGDDGIEQGEDTYAYRFRFVIPLPNGVTEGLRLCAASAGGPSPHEETDDTSEFGGAVTVQ